MTPITHDLKRQIARELEEYHRVFDVFWGLAATYFVGDNHRVKTAAVVFHDRSCHMLISQRFWDQLNSDERLFVILHECLHVMLDHGIRNGRFLPGATPDLVNKAQDITINEMICDLFGFVRVSFRGWERLCWIDTCFKDPSVVKRNQSFLYYLEKLIEHGDSAGGQPLDDHGVGADGLDGDSAGTADGDPDQLAETLGRVLTDAELEYLLGSMRLRDPDDSGTKGRGIGLSPFRVLLKQREPAQVDFNEVVKGLKRNALTKLAREQGTYARSNRRLYGSGPLVLPGSEPLRPHTGRLITLVFFDVSGSVMPHLSRFAAVKDAFEREKATFDVRTYAFDTVVKPVRVGEPLAVGGGTSFDIIEDECQRVAKADGRYPDCVVVITDGYGSEVAPEHPGRWVWLLTTGYREFVHSRSKALPIKHVAFS